MIKNAYENLKKHVRVIELENEELRKHIKTYDNKYGSLIRIFYTLPEEDQEHLIKLMETLHKTKT